MEERRSKGGRRRSTALQKVLISRFGSEKWLNDTDIRIRSINTTQQHHASRLLIKSAAKEVIKTHRSVQVVPEPFLNSLGTRV